MLRSGVTFYLASHFPSPFSSVLGRTSLGRDSRQNERANLSLCLDKREKISMALKFAYVHIKDTHFAQHWLEQNLSLAPTTVSSMT